MVVRKTGPVYVLGHRCVDLSTHQVDILINLGLEGKGWKKMLQSFWKKDQISTKTKREREITQNAP